MPAHPFQLIRLDRIASTQQEAREHARSGCRSGIVILAEEQTAGRGRGDRVWESNRGLGLWFTLVHRSVRGRDEWPALTVASAVALCEAIEMVGLRPRTRWPNDVLLSGRKVAGVLADTEGDAILIGIGLNILHRADDFSPQLRGTATSIGLAALEAGTPPPDPDGLLVQLLECLDRLLQEFERSGPSAAIPAFWARSIDRSMRIAIRLPSAALVEGRAIGLGEIGQLLVETPEGTVVVPSGTVVWREGA
jgi:BirA family biotin operon repressor/biotin-[acetyl-CoA-carboxylase] ligase